MISNQGKESLSAVKLLIIRVFFLFLLTETAVGKLYRQRIWDIFGSACVLLLFFSPFLWCEVLRSGFLPTITVGSQKVFIGVAKIH